MSLTSEELNLLVYHYLEDAGFSHSAYVFHQETIRKYASPITKVPPGALINVIQKGLQYMEIEAHITEEGEEKKCNAPFTLLGEHQCDFNPTPTPATTTVTVLATESVTTPTSKPRKRARANTLQDSSATIIETLTTPSKPSATAPNTASLNQKQPPSTTNIKAPTNGLVNGTLEATISAKLSQSTITPTVSSSSLDVGVETSVVPAKPLTNNIGKQQQQPTELDPRDRPYKVVMEEEATILLGHESEVYICAWNPIFPTHIATGSNDGGGRVWRLPCSSKSDKILSHYLGYNSNSESRDIAAIDWHPKGTVLVIGSYDGYVRQYTHSGWLRFKGEGHESPVLSVKYNSRGNLILSGSMDMSARIWCSTEGTQLQQIEWHNDAVVDVDWKCEKIFSTCSVDGLIYTGQFEEPDPICAFSGHKGPVNSIKWDPTGSLLASCSDDMTIKVWSMDQTSPLKDMTGHQGSISALKWSPGPVGPSQTHILATASDDKTVCVWDVSNGALLYRFAQHSVRVSSITFSPDSKYLASSAFDSSIHVFSTEDGKLVRSFFRQGEIFDVKWSPSGESLAACFADSSVALFDLAK